ncbi:MAG: sensor histidine kinase [Pseudomonadota bacterium]
MRGILLIIGIWLNLAVIGAGAQERPLPLVLKGPVLAEELDGYLETLLDTEGTVTIANQSAAGFTPLEGHNINYDYTKGTIWIRLSVENATEREDDWRLAFRENFFPWLRAWKIGADGAPELLEAQDPRTTYSDRKIDHPEVTIPVRLQPGEAADLIIAYRSGGASQTTFSILPLDDFVARANSRMVQNAIYYGMVLALTIAALLAYVAMRNAVFAAYALYACGVLLFLMHADGNAFRYLWPDAAALNSFASVVTGSLIIIGGASFARIFLQTSRYHPWLDKVLLFDIVLTIGMVASTILVDTQLIKKLLVLLAFLSILLFAISGFIAALSRLREVRFYVIAWSGAVISSAIMTSRHWLGLDISEEVQFASMRIVTVTDAAFMGLAILDRFNQMNRQRSDALKASLETAQRGLRLSSRLQDLEARYVVAQELAESRDRRLSDTVHDLRQPLQALRLNVQSLISDEVPSDSKVKDLEDTFAYLDQLIADELEIKPGDLVRAEPNGVHLGELMAAVHGMFQADAADKGLRFDVVPCTHRIALPPLDTMRIVTNLVSNAIKYTQQGRVLMGVRRAGRFVRIEVHDTGPGLDAAAFEQACARSVRLTDLDDPVRGSGLGLAIVTRVAETHGLIVDVAPGRKGGTGVRVTVPLI